MSGDVMPIFMDGNKLIASFTPEGSPIVLNSPVDGWYLDGVPALYGTTEGDSISERWGLVPPSDPFFNLCVLDQAERRDWTVIPDPEPVTIKELAERFAVLTLPLLKAKRGNPYHEPAGTPEGGQFASGASGVAIVPKPSTIETAALPPPPPLSHLKGIRVTGSPSSLKDLANAFKLPDVSRVDLANIVGANDNAKVELKTLHIGVRGRKIYNIMIDGPTIKTMQRDIYIEKNGDIVMHNHILMLEKGGEGEGTRMFAREVATIAKLGFKAIQCQAERGKDFNGYYTWARLGYDGEIPKKVRESLAFESSPYVNMTKVSQLMKTQAGRDWWKANGDTWNATFDLQPKSISIRVLAAYLKERGLKI